MRRTNSTREKTGDPWIYRSTGSGLFWTGSSGGEVQESPPGSVTGGGGLWVELVFYPYHVSEGA